MIIPFLLVLSLPNLGLLSLSHGHSHISSCSPLENFLPQNVKFQLLAPSLLHLFLAKVAWLSLSHAKWRIYFENGFLWCYLQNITKWYLNVNSKDGKQVGVLVDFSQVGLDFCLIITSNMVLRQNVFCNERSFPGIFFLGFPPSLGE